MSNWARFGLKAIPVGDYIRGPTSSHCPIEILNEIGKPSILNSQDDDTEEMFDVGTAVANPYVCDSWPFEPNVLAKRTPQESSMPTFEEETEDDLKEAERGFRTNPFRSLRFPPGPSGAASDDDDDRYPGTARSL